MMSDMTHIEEGRLQALLDGEAHLDERRRAELHLQGCDDCRQELEAMRDRSAGFARAMETLDHAPRSREHAIGWPRSERLSTVRRYLPRAAVLLLFVGAGASATVPGSPVREWLVSLGNTRSAAEAVQAVAPEVVSAPAAPERVEAGVSVEAADGAVHVLVRDAAELRVRATLVEGTRAGVYAVGGAAESRFVTGAGRIEVLGPSGGELRIEIPRGTATASVKINDSEILRMQNGRFDLSAEEAGLDAAGIAFSVEP